MRLQTVLGLAAVAILCVASDAAAQPGQGRGFGRGFGGGVSHMGLLRVEKVQEEIDLTDEQQDQVQAARQESREARRGQGGPGNFQDLSDEERQEFFARARERRQELNKAEKEKLSGILKDEQMKRLNEIYIQVAGGQALDDEGVAAALKITDDQKEKLTAAHEEARNMQREEMRGLFQSGDREAAQAKMAEVRKKADAIILAVLTDEQKQQFEELKGEAIELSQDDLRRASGFGGGRGRGGQQDNDA